MSTVYEKILLEDIEVGTTSATRTAPGGGTMSGTQVNPAGLLPQMDQTAIDALSPSGIMMVWNTTTETIQFYNGHNWTEVLTGML